MQFTNEHVFPARIERVEAMYWDPSFCPRKYRQLGLREVEVISKRKTSRDFHIQCRFRMKPSLELPAFTQQFIGRRDWLSVSQTDVWDIPSRTGRLDIVLESLESVSIRCDMQLLAHPQGTVNRMLWNVDCALPLIGEALANFLAEDIQSKFDDDFAVTYHILSDY